MEAILIEDGFVEYESTVKPAVKMDSRTIFPIVDTSSEDDIEIIDHSASSSSRIGNVEPPPQPTIPLFPYNGIGNENGYVLNPKGTEKVILNTTNETDRAETIAPVPSSNLTTDPFNTSMGGFFENLDYNMDDVYGGIA